MAFPAKALNRLSAPAKIPILQIVSVETPQACGAEKGYGMTKSFEDHCWQGLVPEDILEIYQAYARDIYVGEKPAILAIDMYEKAYAGGPLPVSEVNKKFPGSCGIHAWNAIAPTQALFATARKAGVPVIHTTGNPTPVKSKVQATNRQRGQESANALAFKAEVAPLQGELVIAKNRASAFFGTPLIAHLRQMDIRSLIVCGESTSGCVRASVVDAYSHGFHTVVAEECVFDRSMLSHRISLFDLHHKYADVMRVDEVVAHLETLDQTDNAA
jgi:nicotinamidase-related amidase